MARGIGKLTSYRKMIIGVDVNVEYLKLLVRYLCSWGQGKGDEDRRVD